MKRLVFLILALFIVQIAVGPYATVLADDYDEVTRQLEDTKKQLEGLQKANQNNKTNLKNINDQIESVKRQVANLEAEIVRKEKQVDQGEEKLAKQKELLDQRIVSYYKNMEKNSSSLIQVFASGNLSDSLRKFFYQKAYMDEDKKQIIKESNYTYRDALEVSAYLIEVGKFERFYKEMQIHDLQKELDEMDDGE